MNTAERIVEAYFRHCLDCFTMTDVKVEAGNNRQLDLIAVQLRSGDSYHVETSVKHPKSYWPTLGKLEIAFRHKFFGAPRENTKPRGDYALGKDYRPAINRTYKRLGLIPSKVQRIYVCWAIQDADPAETEVFLPFFLSSLSPWKKSNQGVELPRSNPAGADRSGRYIELR
jgi:hypothetical protein